jgi:hypothetical protein
MAGADPGTVERGITMNVAEMVRCRRLVGASVMVGLCAVAAACTTAAPSSQIRAVDDSSLTPTTVVRGEEAIELTNIGPLIPGEYFFDWDGYRVTFTVGENWRLAIKMPTLVTLGGPGDPNQSETVFVGFGHLVDGAIPIDPWAGLDYTEPDNYGPLPEDLAQWFVGLPFVEASPLAQVRAGDLDGVRTEITVADLPDQTHLGCSPVIDDCIAWSMFGEDYRVAAPLQDGFAGTFVFFDTHDWPIAGWAVGRAAVDGDSDRAENLASATAIIDSLEIREHP